MALRPVSELGLVDLTDLASPPAASTTKRQRTDGGAPKESSRPSERREGAPRAKPRRSSDADSAAIKAPAPDRASRHRSSRTVAEKVGISVTCVVAGAAGVLLGRAAVRS
jgi:hypothetical protein